MTCYMCGSKATKRLMVDIDIDGIPVCDANECASYLNMALLVGEDEEDVERIIHRDRKRLHKAHGNKFTT